MIDTRQHFSLRRAVAHFLVGTVIGEPTAPSPTVILNWTAALKK
jgi:hypothetical protein